MNWLGSTLIVSGRELVLLVAVLVVGLAIVYTNYLGFREVGSLLKQGVDAQSEYQRGRHEEHDAILSGHIESAREARILNYLLSLPTEQRPRLMPPADLYERMVPRQTPPR